MAKSLTRVGRVILGHLRLRPEGLLLAREPVGIKPLYWGRHGKTHSGRERAEGVSAHGAEHPHRGHGGAPDLDAARQVARHFDTQHHEMVHTAKELFEALPQVIRVLESLDAPIVRSAIPMQFVSKLAAEHVRVALSGEGPAGYTYLGKMNEAALERQLAQITVRLIAQPELRVQGTNLPRADWMRMAHGLEARAPFLDEGFVRYASRLPVDLLRRAKGRPEKWLLREAVPGPPPRGHRVAEEDEVLREGGLGRVDRGHGGAMDPARRVSA